MRECRMRRCDTTHPPAPHQVLGAGAALLALTLALLMLIAACGGRGYSGAPQNGTEPAPPGFSDEAAAEKAHPRFELTADQLDKLVRDLPDELSEGVRSDRQGFLSALEPVLDQPAELTRLVNKEVHLPADFRPHDLIELDHHRDRFVLNRSGMKLSERALDPLTAMVEAALGEGITLDLSSVYRSIEYQRGLFERYTRVHGREAAERFSAEPGASEHHLGTAIDFGSITPEFAETEAGRWLQEHAWRFGFSLSYPQGKEWLTGYIYEPWHYRYIGRAATELKREYFGGIQHYVLEFLHDHRGTLKQHRIAQR